MFPDVVVVGSGIIGSACAYYLAREGLAVRVIEKGPLVSGSSRACTSHLCLWEEPEVNLSLAKASRLLYEDLLDELPFDIEYRRTGCLAVVEDSTEWPSFQSMLHSLRVWGLEFQVLDPDDVVRMEPGIAPAFAGGAFFPEDAQLNPMLASLALASAAQERGAELQPFTEVTGIQVSGGAVVAVDTDAGRVPTGAVVNAAGSWSGSIGAMAHVDIPVVPRKGHVVVTESAAHTTLNCKIILAFGYMQTLSAGEGVAVAANIQQTSHGNLLLSSSREFVGFSRSVRPRVVSAMLLRCLRLFPRLGSLHAIRCFAGLRPYSPDLVPIIGAVEGVDGFYVATGHEGAGITMGPVSGRLISQIVMGQAPEVPVERLSLSRFKRAGRHNARQSPDPAMSALERRRDGSEGLHT